MHPGYIRMFKEAKEHCNHLTVALHEDPSMARPHKLKPVQTVEDRKEILYAIKYVDDVVVYQAEDGIRDEDLSRGLGDVYKRQECTNLIDNFLILVPITLIYLDIINLQNLSLIHI